MKKELVYDFSQHSIYYENIYHIYIEREILLTIGDTIEMSFDYDTGKLISIGGFLPLINAIKKEIQISNFIDGDYIIDTKSIPYLKGVGYDYFDYFKKSECYFIQNNLPIVYYDEKNKRILIGAKNGSEKCIRINRNIYCGFDKEDHLMYLLIYLDKTIPCN